MNKRNSILEAAAKLFSEKGFRETPMTEISRITGAAEGTIFYHFKNKEELFVAILEDLKKTSSKSLRVIRAERSSRPAWT
jgi:AcrR family transcriptional regulator